jgi:hypothetical protein
VGGSRLIALLLIAAAALGASGCGGDDDSDSGDDTGAAAVAPAPDDAFKSFSTALEGQGMTVAELPADELDGAETGVSISGSKSGSGRLFSDEEKAKAYADDAAGGDDKTKVVGTVVFTAPTQADADFFADAYEGG